eukprot:Nk52_evm20s272 gene=Nk52_evmTU20s272
MSGSLKTRRREGAVGKRDGDEGGAVQCPDPKMQARYVQITASRAQVDERIAQFCQQKRRECNISNVREFLDQRRRGHKRSVRQNEEEEKEIDEEESTCARCDAAKIKRHSQSSHIKVTRTINEYGPLLNNTSTKRSGNSISGGSEDPSHYVSSMAQSTYRDTWQSLGERLTQLESHLLPTANPNDDPHQNSTNLGKLLPTAAESGASSSASSGVRVVYQVPPEVTMRLKGLEDRLLALENSPSIPLEYLRALSTRLTGTRPVIELLSNTSAPTSGTNSNEHTSSDTITDPRQLLITLPGPHRGAGGDLDNGRAQVSSATNDQQRLLEELKLAVLNKLQTQ